MRRPRSGDCAPNGAYPEEMEYSPCPVGRTVDEGDVLQIGEARIRVLATPGHCRGHVSYLLEENGGCPLFSGDAVFADGKIGFLNFWDASIHDCAASMAKLHDLKADRLFAGHGAFLLSETWRDIESAHQIFQSRCIPQNSA